MNEGVERKQMNVSDEIMETKEKDKIRMEGSGAGKNGER